MQLHSNKQEHSVNFVKLINYETNPILAIKQLYRRQCYYSDKVSSVLIQFSLISVDVAK